MKKRKIPPECFFIFCFCSAVASGAFARTLFSDAFDSGTSRWDVTVHEKFVTVEFGAKGRNFTGLVVRGAREGRTDTAWSVRTPEIGRASCRERV